MKKELPVILIVLFPFIYLFYFWEQLPDKVPLHWNFEGEIDRYGSKLELLLIPILLPLLTYLLILIVPKIDPKQKLKLMGNKLFKIKLFLTLIMSILSLFIIEASRNESLENPNYIYLFLGILFIVLGNYSKTIKHNYFIGIRTPWTLENETVWNETHKLGGKFWFIGGMLIVFSSLILGTQINKIFTISVISIITLIPVIYSYFAFKRIQNEK